MTRELRGRHDFAEHIKTTKEKIDVIGGAYLNQNKCHANALHYARKHKEDKIAMVVTINDNYPCAHFVNFNKDGKYIDNTLGELTRDYDYYLVKLLQQEEHFKIYDIFNNYLKEAKRHIRPWSRFILGSNGRVC